MSYFLFFFSSLPSVSSSANNADKYYISALTHLKSRTLMVQSVPSCLPAHNQSLIKVALWKMFYIQTVRNSLVSAYSSKSLFAVGESVCSLSIWIKKKKQMQWRKIDISLLIHSHIIKIVMNFLSVVQNYPTNKLFLLTSCFLNSIMRMWRQWPNLGTIILKYLKYKSWNG